MTTTTYKVYSVRKNGKRLYQFTTQDYNKVERFKKENPTLTVEVVGKPTAFTHGC